MKSISYKGHILTINELPSFCSNSKLYRGMSIINSKDWKLDADSIDKIKETFKSRINNLEMDKLYKEVYDSWGSNCNKITYKNWNIGITVKKRYKDHKLVYLGEFYKDKKYSPTSIESIHYDKVISKFKKFVDEHCIDWHFYRVNNYKGYTLTIQKNVDQDNKVNYFGTCKIHKNSTFKCITNPIIELEAKFKSRIDKIIECKEKTIMTPISSKEEKIKKLESEIAKLQKELESIKKEKDIYEYKGVTLDIIKEDNLLIKGYRGVIRSSEDIDTFFDTTIDNVKLMFEDYIDELQRFAQLYCELTNKMMIFNGK